MESVTLPSDFLAACADAPARWWVRGELDVFRSPAVAVVGSRRAGPDALRFAYRISRALAARGYVVVSGLARGVDTAAHAGALAVGGRTVAVLAHGLDRVYPPENTDLARRLCERGACLSQYPPGEEPRPWRFPQRNRWIAALSLGVVVVEAGEKSGSLGTARAALELGREVFVAPGPATAESYRGAHRLLQDGAKLIVDDEDVVEELPPPWRLAPPEAAPPVREPSGATVRKLAGSEAASLHAALAEGRALPYGVGQVLWLDDGAPSLAKPK